MSLSFSITRPTRGNTGTPSIIQINRLAAGEPLPAGPFFCRVRVCNANGFANATNATIAADTGTSIVETHTGTKDLTFKSAPPAGATGTLTVSGVVIDGETVTLGNRVYEFDTQSTAGITSGNVRVNISASATKAAGTLTLALQPAALETFTIGNRTYVWVASGTADNPGEISRGADLAAAKVNFVAAINGTDGVNTAHSQVTAAAFSSNNCVITAIKGGTAGNALVTTEAMAGSGNQFDAATLGTTTAGTDCTATNATAALTTAINADTLALVTAVNASSSTVVVTAKATGPNGNSIASTETMANGAFGGATLTGGVNSNVNNIRVAVTDATAESVTIRLGPALVSPSPADHSEILTFAHAAP
jgi:hypothetical protein